MSGRPQGFLRNINLSARALRLAMNVWPPYVGAGVRVLQISEDFRRVTVRMRLRWFNRNYVGTHFGGSLYTMTDPFFALMMMHNLGHEYVVWDKSARIHFRSPGKGTVVAEFIISEDDVEEARRRTDGGRKYEPAFSVEVIGPGGAPVATVEKTLYIRRRTGTLAS